MLLPRRLAPVSGWVVVPFPGGGHLARDSLGGVLSSFSDRWCLTAWGGQGDRICGSEPQGGRPGLETLMWGSQVGSC